MRRSYLNTHGAEHARVAKAVHPVLSRTRTASNFERAKKIMAEEVAQWPVHRTVDLYSLVRLAAQHMAFSLLFGEDDLARIRELGALLGAYHTENWKAGPYVLPFNLVGLPYHRVFSLAEELRARIGPWVRQRDSSPPGADLRAVFAQFRDSEGRPLTAGQLASQFNLLGFASYETMSTAVTWTLFLLMLHPEIAADLLDELSAAPDADTITESELDALPLLDGVVKESLRLIPPAPIVPLRIERAIEVAGFTLDLGTQVMLTPYLTHRLPQLYENPTRFIPARWRNIDPTPYQFHAFSAGSRRCPGYYFALSFMKTALHAILPRYSVRVRSGARVDRVYRGVMMPRPGIPITLVPQDRNFSRAEIGGNILDCVTLDAGT
jgi:cytochrome P450